MSPEKDAQRVRRATAIACILFAAFATRASGQQHMRVAENSSGVAATVSSLDLSATSNAFFQSLGTNGRACVTCHSPDAGWTLTPANLQRRLADSAGLDPVSRTNDGSNSPTAGTSTVRATCTTRHDSPNVGNHSAPLALNIGISDANRPYAGHAAVHLEKQAFRRNGADHRPRHRTHYGQMSGYKGNSNVPFSAAWPRGTHTFTTGRPHRYRM